LNPILYRYEQRIYPHFVCLFPSTRDKKVSSEFGKNISAAILAIDELIG